MGCIFDKNHQETRSETKMKTYSWDVRRNLDFDSKNFIIENEENRDILRKPESVNGQQFIIQNCRNTSIFIIDFLDTVSIDDCKNCVIVLGAVKSSVFMRNCVDCVCISACGQFRTRDCRKCSCYVHSVTQPIIETSTKMKFGNYRLSYSKLPIHLTEANIDLCKVLWTEVYDFTPVTGECNWNFLEDERNYHVLGTKSESIHSQLDDLKVAWRGLPPHLIQLESTV